MQKPKPHNRPYTICKRKRVTGGIYWLYLLYNHRHREEAKAQFFLGTDCEPILQIAIIVKVSSS